MKLKIAQRTISEKHPVFFVAEISANHGQKLSIALKLMDAAKKAGADAVKFQVYTPETLTLNCRNKYFKISHNSPWKGLYLYDLYKQAYTPWNWFEKIHQHANDIDIIWFASVFDCSSVDFLDEFNLPAYKISSFELNDNPLIEYVAKKMKPMILSTGLSSKKEINQAIRTCQQEGNKQIAILKCTSSYPAPFDEANLKTLEDIRRTYNVEVGLSDHTTGYIAPVVAVSFKAKIIEKHLKLNNRVISPDKEFSIMPSQFKKMINAVKQAELAIGSVNYNITKSAEKNLIFKRSLFVVKDISKGELFTEQNIKSIRPGYGAEPKILHKIIGKKSNKDIKKGTPFNVDFILDSP